MTEDILKKKDFPMAYPKDVMELIRTMSMTKLKSIQVVGSMSLRSQQYAGDYDLIETVKGKYASDNIAIDTYVRTFQHIVRELLKRKDCYIGDIKSGEIPEWKIVPDTIQHYSYIESIKTLKHLLSTNVVTKTEYDEAFSILKPFPTSEDFIEMKRTFRFNVVRWSPKEIFCGYKKLADGRTYSLYESFTSPFLTKLDIVAYVQNARFTDFSCIYIFENTGRLLNRIDIARLDESIQEDIIFFASQGKWFKVAKRMFSTAKFEKNKAVLNKLNDLLNGDLGRLYSIVSDGNTILYLLENEDEIPIDKIKYEIDQFRARYANIYTIKTAIKKESFVLSKILDMESLPNTASGRLSLFKQMTNLIEFFETLLNKNAKQELIELNLL